MNPDARRRAGGGRRAPGSGDGYASKWGLALAALLALIVGLLFGLVSSLVNSLRYVVLAALACALLCWLVYAVEAAGNAQRRRQGLRRTEKGARNLTGAVLATSVGLAAAGDATAGVFAVLALVAFSRITAGRRR